jgi:hypothetical protein
MTNREIKKEIARNDKKGTLPEWDKVYIYRPTTIKRLKGETVAVKQFVLVELNDDDTIKSKRVFKDWKLYKDRTDWEFYS